MPSYHKVVNGAVPHGTEPADITLRLQITRHHIHALTELTGFKQYLSLTEFNFSKPLSAAQQLNAVDNLLQTQDFLKESYGKVIIATDTFPALVPKGFEKHTGADTTLQQVSEDIFTAIEDNQLMQKLHSHFPVAIVTDVYTTFLQQVIGLPAGIYTLVTPDSLTIAAIAQPGNLLLLNSYEYQTAEDFIYYLLLVCDELKTDREKIPLVLCGTIQQQSKIYDVCYRYFSNILFLKPETGRNYANALKEVSPHIHFTLYGLGVKLQA